MRKFGLIGHPIGHSLSPALFKAGYDGKYTYDLIETPDFEEAYQHFLNDYDGINVTAPFKELAIRKADILSEECKAIGATNLLIKTPGGIKAYNSDFLGVRLWINMVSGGLKSVLPPWPQGPVSDQQTVRGTFAANSATKLRKGFFFHPYPDHKINVLIIGWGGASKAAKAAAESLGFTTTVINRTQYTPDIKPLRAFREEFLKADIIIYNLPVRLPELDHLGHKDFIEGRPKHILEANYRDPSFDNKLISRLKALHSQTEYTSGKTWLLLQALTGYEIFTGEQPDLTKMTASL
jgi:shikimate 5-dehydrogenase